MGFNGFKHGIVAGGPPWFVEAVLGLVGGAELRVGESAGKE